MSTWPTPKAHHSQLPAIPREPTTPAMYSGVSMENVVAAIDVPASHHGSERPETKKSSIEPEARRARYTPIPSVRTM